MFLSKVLSLGLTSLFLEGVPTCLVMNIDLHVDTSPSLLISSSSDSLFLNILLWSLAQCSLVPFSFSSHMVASSVPEISIGPISVVLGTAASHHLGTSQKCKFLSQTGPPVSPALRLRICALISPPGDSDPKSENHKPNILHEFKGKSSVQDCLSSHPAFYPWGKLFDLSVPHSLHR